MHAASLYGMLPARIAMQPSFLRSLFTASLLAALAFSSRFAHAQAATGCVKDTECKGERICVAGQCVFPPSPNAPPAPPPVSPAPPPAAPPPNAAPPEPPAPPAMPPAEPAPLPAPPPAPEPPAPAPPPGGTLTPAIVAPSGPPSAQPPGSPQMVVLYTPPSEDKVSKSGISIGVRFGIGFPAGPAEAPSTIVGMDGMLIQSSGELGDAVGVILPVTVDVGYRINPHWYTGGYVSVAYGTAPSSACASMGTDAASCYESDIRLGLDVQYNFFPTWKFQPWLGVGAGWEILNSIATDDAGDEESGSINGVEFAHIDLGVDYQFADRQRTGPYFTTTFGDYTSAPAGIPPTSQTIFVHEWFMVGWRWRYDTNLWHR
jgi:hypothetical protein